MRGLTARLSLVAPENEQAHAAHGRFWIAVSAILFGAMAVTTRAVSKEIGAAQIAFVRFSIGLLGVLLVTSFRPKLFGATKWSGLALRGLFGGLAVLGYFMAIERLGAGLGTLLNYTFPLWASVFAAVFLGERLTIRTGIGMLLATAGLVVIIGPVELRSTPAGLEFSPPTELMKVLGGAGDPKILVGLLAGAISSVFGGAATTVVRALRRTESALAIFGAFCGIGMVVCLPIAWMQWRPVSVKAGALLLLIGMLSFGAQLLFTYSLKYITAGAGSLTTQLTVVASYSLAALFLGERIRSNVLMGGAIVMTGVLIVSLASPHKAPAPVEAQVE